MRNLAIRLTVVLIGVWGSAAYAEDFVTPFGGQVYFKVTTAKTGAAWTFGIGTTSQNCHVYLSSLPNTSFPTNEVSVGYFNAGETIRFCMWSQFGTNTAWAFSDGTDPASLVAFSDTTDALQMGGNIIAQTGATTWLMHLDNAVSYLYDDSNNDILMQIRIDPSFVSPQPNLGNFIVPSSGSLYARCVGGIAGATSVFGIGTSATNFVPTLTGLPALCTGTEVLVGSVIAGQVMQFGISTVWTGQTWWAFSGGSDQASLVSFTDVCNTLGLNGSVYQQTGPATWVMHLSDAAHYTYDICDANNILIQLRIGPVSQQGPSISHGGIVPIYSTASVIQSGEWVSIYGSNLASGITLWNGDFPVSLGGTSVSINGKAAYIWVVSPGQINLQSPDDTATGTVPVVVTTAAGSAASTVTLDRFAPSLSLLDAQHVTGIILRSNGSGSNGGGSYDILGPTGSSLGYPTVAAKAGDSIVLFGVGFGPTNPTVTSGVVFSSAASTTNPVQLVIGGKTVTPSFAGLSSAGLYQINVTIPAGLGTDDESLTASVAGVQTQPGVVISLQ